jgi:hypothetical protein
MTAVRKALGMIAELALEAFITGLFMQAGESIVTESIRAAKKRGKKKKRDDDTAKAEG